MKCKTCGNPLRSVELCEVATMYGCPQGHEYYVEDPDDFHKLYTSREVSNIVKAAVATKDTK